MKGCYYSFRIFIDDYPLPINCKDLTDMTDKISDLFGCRYNYLGYMLLDPDDDFKDLGIMLKNNDANRIKFMNLSIPINYIGRKTEYSTSPFLIFELRSKNNLDLPPYIIQLEYPVKDTQFLCIKIDISDELLTKEITMMEFKNVQDIISSKGYVIHSSFLHYYFGTAHRAALDGIEYGITTVNDWRIINHSIKYRENWRKQVMDIFYINSFRKEIINEKTMQDIVGIVGYNNIIVNEQKVTFKLPYSKEKYLLNRIISDKSRNCIKKILEKENVCLKDASILKSFFKL